MIIVADHPHGLITRIHDYLTIPITKEIMIALLGNMNIREGSVNSRDEAVSSLCYSKQVENTPRKQERWCGNLPVAEDNESKYKETDWADTKCSACQTKLTDTSRATLDDNT